MVTSSAARKLLPLSRGSNTSGRTSSQDKRPSEVHSCRAKSQNTESHCTQDQKDDIFRCHLCLRSGTRGQRRLYEEDNRKSRCLLAVRTEAAARLGRGPQERAAKFKGTSPSPTISSRQTTEATSRQKSTSARRIYSAQASHWLIDDH